MSPPPPSVFNRKMLDLYVSCPDQFMDMVSIHTSSSSEDQNLASYCLSFVVAFAMKEHMDSNKSNTVEQEKSPERCNLDDIEYDDATYGNIIDQMYGKGGSRADIIQDFPDSNSDSGGETAPRRRASRRASRRMSNTSISFDEYEGDFMEKSKRQKRKIKKYKSEASNLRKSFTSLCKEKRNLENLVVESKSSLANLKACRDEKYYELENENNILTRTVVELKVELARLRAMEDSILFGEDQKRDVPIDSKKTTTTAIVTGREKIGLVGSFFKKRSSLNALIST